MYVCMYVCICHKGFVLIIFLLHINSKWKSKMEKTSKTTQYTHKCILTNVNPVHCKRCYPCSGSRRWVDSVVPVFWYTPSIPHVITPRPTDRVRRWEWSDEYPRKWVYPWLLLRVISCRWSYWKLVSSEIKRQSRVRWGKSYCGNEDLFTCLFAGHDLGLDQLASKADYAQSRSVQ